MKFIIRFDGRFYYVNDRRIDSDADTVAYFIRTMCKIPPAKRPNIAEIRAVCGAVKFLREPLSFTIT